MHLPGAHMAAPSGLKTHHAAAGGGDTDRAAPIRRMGERHQSRRDRRRSPAAGPSSRPIERPGISDRAIEERLGRRQRSEEHTTELQSLMRISYAVFCLKKKKEPS